MQAFKLVTWLLKKAEVEHDVIWNGRFIRPVRLLLAVGQSFTNALVLGDSLILSVYSRSYLGLRI